tara:strand:- start:5 stop:238 length:234 start_codon:yes stop_codon:yes gene_type:complete
MAIKKKEIATSNGGKQVFLSFAAIEALKQVQFIMGSQSPTAMQKYGGSRGVSPVVEELAKGALAMRGSAEDLAEKTS